MPKKITDLGSLATADAADLLPTVDVSAGGTKKVTIAGIVAAIVASLTNNTISPAKLLYGLVRRRQGSTTGDNSWVTAGTNNTDTSAKAVFEQVGSAVGTTVDANVTFDVPFNQTP